MSAEGYNAEYPYEGCSDESISLSINLKEYYNETFEQ